jgi:hypothetical protein
LAGTSATTEGKPAQSYKVKKQSLLVGVSEAIEPGRARPEQPKEAEVIEAEVIEQPTGEQQRQEQQDPAFREWHRVADARRKKADEAAEAWTRLELR